MSLKNSNDTIENRTRDLPVCNVDYAASSSNYLPTLRYNLSVQSSSVKNNKSSESEYGVCKGKELVVISNGIVVQANRGDVGGRKDGGKCSHLCYFAVRRSGSGKFVTGAEEKQRKLSVRAK